MKATALPVMRTAVGATLLLSASLLRAADWQVTGLLREEVAAPLDNQVNPQNQQGNVFNGVAVPNTGLGPVLAPGASPATLVRPASNEKHNTWNMFATRLEVSVDGKMAEDWAAHFKLRGYTDQVGHIDNAFENVDLFREPLRASGNGAMLELARKDWMLDLPAAYVDYNHGPLWVRVGNQQVAWGEAIFFRVVDVPNGLDYRRHSILDVAAEEYSDKRVPAPGIRTSYRVTNDWTVEAFGQRFNPSILADPNSPYNTIPDQFTVEQRQGYDDAKNDWNFGARLQGKVGDVGLQFMAAHRHNPDGVFRWTDSHAGVLSGTPFQAGTGQGVYSAAEWFRYAQLAGLDGVGGLAAALNEHPPTNPVIGATALAVLRGCGATLSPRISFSTPGSASCVLDSFFDPVVGLGNLVGHIAREYPSENIYGFGANYIFEGAPDSFLDQLITRFELSYTPEKKFTNPTLSDTYVKSNETAFALIFEKNYKISPSVPATYIVAQWLHKTSSDLFGRSLRGLGGPDTAGSPSGLSHYDAAVLALQQPSPTLEWRGDLTVLTDFRGGWLIQPGVKWHPSKSFQVDAYANVILDEGSNGNFGQNLISAREAFARFTYYF
jgi:Protein of unknown function (DUF1302)